MKRKLFKIVSISLVLLMTMSSFSYAITDTNVDTTRKNLKSVQELSLGSLPKR